MVSTPGPARWDGARSRSQPTAVTVATYLHAARRLLQRASATQPVMDALIKAEAEAKRAARF